MSSELVLDRVDQPDVQPELTVLVRTLTLPPITPRQALAAARLRLDQLSPSPPDEVLIDVASLGDGPAGQTRWAVGIARKADVVRLCAASGRDTICVSRTIESRDVDFRFRGARARIQLPENLRRWAAPSAAVFCTLAALLAALSLRVERQMRSEGLGDGAAEQIVDRQWRIASDRDVAVRSWINVSRDPAARVALCGLARLNRDAPGPKRVVSLDASPGALTLVLAGRTAASPAQGSGVTVSADSGSPGRLMVRLTSETCAEPATR